MTGSELEKWISITMRSLKERRVEFDSEIHTKKTEIEYAPKMDPFDYAQLAQD